MLTEIRHWVADTLLCFALQIVPKNRDGIRLAEALHAWSVHPSER